MTGALSLASNQPSPALTVGLGLNDGGSSIATIAVAVFCGQLIMLIEDSISTS